MSAVVMMHHSVVPTASVAQPMPRTRLRAHAAGQASCSPTLAAAPLVAWALAMVLGSGGAAGDDRDARQHRLPVRHGRAGESSGRSPSRSPPTTIRGIVIDEIIRLNGLDDALVEPGQRLALPAVPEPAYVGGPPMWLACASCADPRDGHPSARR